MGGPSKTSIQLDRTETEGVFLCSMGVQQSVSNEWSVGETGNITGTRTPPASDKVDLLATWTEVGPTNKT